MEENVVLTNKNVLLVNACTQHLSLKSGKILSIAWFLAYLNKSRYVCLVLRKLSCRKLGNILNIYSQLRPFEKITEIVSTVYI